ncbi:Dot/Icm T4SS effector AnkY/LegA9 [Legionella yabuuchiae]|uniref:Dot/Icm T4SS effector AnkY/LegA9 n=1 Tax=Legionella yabuuchiae TaxID=376727 RepID=UPI001054CB1D|nr:Dot/Icm T4SS effector AnkY/LegA9 [Legionella yabuuchiae]
MSNIILVYANCHNSTARGDFVLAGTMARDLMREIKRSGQDIDVILTSTLDGMSRFESLYKSVGRDRVDIEGVEVGLCSLERFDSLTQNVIAFIEANRCKYAPAEVIKRVLSADSKLLTIMAPNGETVNNDIQKIMQKILYSSTQPSLYEFFEPADVLINASGLAPEALGLPHIAQTSELSELTAGQRTLVPTVNYGFMYLSANIDSRDPALIAQYMNLTDPVEEYILVGNFTDVNQVLTASRRFPYSRTTSCNVKFHQSLEYGVMRHMMMNSTHLVLATGVMSTLEAMQDRKLTYYQDISNNVSFVISYLMALKSLVYSDTSLVGLMPKFMVELSALLFESKPLKPADLDRARTLLEMTPVRERLADANQTLITKANGTLAPRLLSFIGAPKASRLEDQAAYALRSLRKQAETTITQGQGLRRAASWGRLFELKILVRSMAPEELNAFDPTYKRGALHWAIHYGQYDCVQILIKAGALLDLQDKDDRTPLHHAVIKKDRKGVQLLLDAGASIDILDSRSQSPIHCADENTLSFIHSCREESITVSYGTL